LFINDSGEDDDLKLAGDVEREDPRDDDVEDGLEDGKEPLSTLAGKEGCDCAFGIGVRCAIFEVELTR